MFSFKFLIYKCTLKIWSWYFLCLIREKNEILSMIFTYNKNCFWEASKFSKIYIVGNICDFSRTMEKLCYGIKNNKPKTLWSCDQSFKTTVFKFLCTKIYQITKYLQEVNVWNTSEVNKRKFIIEEA